MISYLGLYVNFWTYIALLLFALIIFAIILIVAEKKRQRRYYERLRKLKKSAELRLIG